METRLLRYFSAVAESGSVSAAALRLGITQPTLSRQLKQLEVSTGLKLFQRSGVALILTAEGQKFLQVARQALHKLDHAQQVAEQLVSGQLMEVSLGAVQTTLSDVVAPFVATFAEADPVPHITEIPVDPELTDYLPVIDIVVTTQLPPKTHENIPIPYVEIAQLAVWAYVPQNHPWSGRPSVEVEDLAHVQLLLPSQEFKARRLLDSAMHLAGITPSSVVQTGHGCVAQALAAAGRGVAVLSDDPRFDLIPLPVRVGDFPLKVHLYAAWRGDHPAAAVLEQLAQRLRSFCTQRYGGIARSPGAPL